MMRRVIQFFLIVAGCIIQSCEGYRFATGKVVDAATNLPLDSVLVEVTTGIQTAYTDSTGIFDVHNKMGGCVFGCKDITVRFSKNNFRTITLSNPGHDVLVLMER